jgi:para-aminobenzoate synthetase component 2
LLTLLLDNNDSFTANLEHLLAACIPGEVQVRPYDALPELDFSAFDLAVISPGPGHPRAYPAYDRLLESGLPILGVCLGLQIINDHFGGDTARLPGCFHGRTDRIVFAGKHFDVARYHSLYLRQPASCLDVTARNAGGVPMAARHVSRKILGYQFHPESFLTTDGPFFIRHALDFFAAS